MRVAPSISLDESTRKQLQQQARRRSVPVRVAVRSRIVLLAADGLQNLQIGAELKISVRMAALWRKRFLSQGVPGLLKDAPRPGRTPAISSAVVEQVIAKTTQTTPANATHWSTRLMAREVGISEASVRRLWRAHGLKPHRVETFKVSNDPSFAAKLEDIVGLYLNPPEHAAVFCVDEKTAIQALDRLDPVLPLSPGRIERHGFEYYRHGTLSLYAALETATGRVHGKTAARHTSQDFVAFLEEVVAQCPAKQQIHIILDNLSAHKTQLVDRFLQENSRVHFHFTPTYSSWLNQVELWFGKIERDLIARGVFTSVNDLARKIRRYIKAYSANAKPIQWKYSDTTRRIRSNELSATGH